MEGLEDVVNVPNVVVHIVGEHDKFVEVDEVRLPFILR